MWGETRPKALHRDVAVEGWEKAPPAQQHLQLPAEGQRCPMRITPNPDGECGVCRPPPHPPAARAPHLLPGDWRAIASPARPLPQVALTSRMTLGKVAKSLHKLVCEVSSPSRNAGDFTTPWNQGHPRTIYVLAPCLNLALSSLFLPWRERALPSPQRF